MNFQYLCSEIHYDLLSSHCVVVASSFGDEDDAGIDQLLVDLSVMLQTQLLLLAKLFRDFAFLHLLSSNRATSPKLVDCPHIIHF